MATHSSVLAWRIPGAWEAGGLPSMGLHRVAHDWSDLAAARDFYFGNLMWRELTHWKRSWYWRRLKAGGAGDDRRWGGWVASPTQWTWVWANSGSWWWTGKPGMLQSMESQWVGHNWATELKRFSLHLFLLLFAFIKGGTNSGEFFGKTTMLMWRNWRQ